MGFKPGEIGNPNGRPKGSRNRRTQEILDLIQSRSDNKDPLDFLAEVISSHNRYDPELKIQASNILAPYLHSKRGTAPAPRFIYTPVEVPHFTSIAEAENYLASIPVLLGKGELDSQSALELSTLTKNWLDAIYSRQDYELKLAAQGATSGEQVIHITGGLPPLPGTNITMPQLDGHTINGEALPALDGPQTDSSSVSDRTEDGPRHEPVERDC
jgi:hypothetical protein